MKDIVKILQVNTSMVRKHRFDFCSNHYSFDTRMFCKNIDSVCT